MEFLGDVRRRIFDDDFLAGARRVCAVLELLGFCMVREVVDLGEHLTDEGWSVQLKMQEGFVVGHGRDPLVWSEL